MSLQDEFKDLLGSSLSKIRDLLQTPIDDMDEAEEQVYAVFSRLPSFIESMRKQGVSGSEISRANQYLSKMIVAFENIKHIYQYRTPRTLRTYSRLFIYTFLCYLL